MALKTIIANMIEARRKYDEQLAALGNDAAVQIAAEFGPLLPPGHVLAWRQYTPYFNDGDACTFRLGDAYLIRVGAEGKPVAPSDVETDEDYELAEDVWDALSNEDGIGVGKSLAECYGQPDREVTAPSGYKYTRRGVAEIEGWSAEKCAALVALWGSMPKDMLEQAFGEHVSVQIRPDGTHETSEYDHD